MESKRRTASGSQKPGPLFSWFVEQEFSPWSAQTHRSPNTHKRYAVSAKSLVGFCGNFPLMDLTPGMVERYKLWRIGQCGPTGVNRDIAALRFILNFAIRLGYIKDNPVTGQRFRLRRSDGSLGHVAEYTAGVVAELCEIFLAEHSLRQVGAGGLVLFSILFLWQIPHFLAIAWIYREDYARGGLPMLPVLDPAGVVTGRQAVANSLALLLVSVVPTIAGLAGRAYLLGAVVLGLAFTAVAVVSAVRRTLAAARALFLASVVYLLALCTLLLVDRI